MPILIPDTVSRHYAALKALLPKKTPTVLIYSSNKSVLWDLIRLERTALNAHPQIIEAKKNGLVIIWDETAAAEEARGGLKTSGYLNPLTLSVCALSKIESIKIAVVDLDAVGHRQQGTFYKNMEKLAPSQFLLRLLTESTRWVPDCVSFLEEPVSPSQAKASVLIVGMLKDKILGLLTAPGPESDHHYLASLIGPMILTGTTDLGDSDQTALLSLFKAVDLINEGGILPRGVFSDSSVRLLVVDDQVNQGWDKWVKLMAPNCRIEKLDTPHSLVTAIETKLANRGENPDCRFSLSFPTATQVDDTDAQSDSQPNPQETILLLDLRLFSGNIAQEVAFVRAILPMCRQYFRAPSRLAWPGFSSTELNTVDTWCDNPKPETRAHFLALSLLPRLLALADMSVPIVLFSSTGQRRIIELLKPYGNIITCFEKPRFTATKSTDLIKETQVRFVEALTKAGELLAARRQCRFVITPVPGIPAEKAITTAQTRYVELFLDEQDWNPRNANSFFTVCGCFAVYEAPTLEGAKSKADLFDNYLVERGLRYFENRPGGGLQVNPVLSKGDDISQCFQGYEKTPGAPKQLGLVRLRIQRSIAGSKRASMFDPVYADNRFHLAMKELLELFFCESVPALNGYKNLNNIIVSVFPATRAEYISQYDNQQAAMRKYGLGQISPEAPQVRDRNLFYSFRSNQVAPLVADIFDAHKMTTKLDRLVAVMLLYRGKFPTHFRCHKCDTVIEVPTVKSLADRLDCVCGSEASWQPDYRALHYLADEVLTEFPDGRRHRYDELFAKNCMPGEFDEIKDLDLGTTLTVGRLLDRKDIAGAVSLFKQAPELLCGKKPRASYWLQNRLAAKLPKMSGQDFLRVVHDLVRRANAA